MCELGRNAEACRLVRSLIQSGQVSIAIYLSLSL